MNDLLRAMNEAEKGKLTDEQKAACMLNIAHLSNKEYGKLDKEDGYNCPKCLNKGYRYGVFQNENYLSMAMVECTCMAKRREYQRNRASGLPEGYSFESYQVNTDWQRLMRDKAKRYLDTQAYRQGAWFYAGGAIGAGKTHIVTALAREVLYNRDVRFISWLREAREMKAAIKEGRDADYNNALYMLTAADVLFIDDFCKGTVTDADLKLAYDILNDRYSARAATLITSERTLKQMDKIDSAIASRIFERAGEYAIDIEDDDGSKNHRYKVTEGVA